MYNTTRLTDRTHLLPTGQATHPLPMEQENHQWRGENEAATDSVLTVEYFLVLRRFAH